MELVRPHLPRGTKLERIGAWSFHNKKVGRNVFASLFQDRKGAPYRIWIHTQYTDDTNEIKTYSQIDILRLLAHELAHIGDWNHTPRHAKKEAKYLSLFMTKLNNTGYISEEHELKESK